MNVGRVVSESSIILLRVNSPRNRLISTMPFNRRRQSRVPRISPVRVCFEPSFNTSASQIENRERHMRVVARTIRAKTESFSQRGSAPKGLRGKQIGLYFANKQKFGHEEVYNVMLDMFAVPSLRHIRPNDTLAMESVGPSLSYDLSKSDFTESMFHFKKIHSPCEAPCEPGTDDMLLRRYLEYPPSDYFQKIQQSLPAFNFREQILQMIDQNPAVILTGETGCGKSTQIPQYILHDWVVNRKQGSECRILCTQPRRICATSLASRVGAEWGDPEAVGYHIRFEKELPRPYGSITFCTTGVALKYIESDPLMSQFSHIIVDEVHERAIESELLLIFLKELLEKRSDAKVILMSASVQADKFSTWLNNAPLFDIPSRRFEVNSFFLEDIIDSLEPQLIIQASQNIRTNKHERKKQAAADYPAVIPGVSGRGMLALQAIERSDRVNYTLVDQAIRWVLSKRPDIQSILVFLPGMTDIGKCSDMLNKNPTLCVLPLHSLLPQDMQYRVFERAPGNKKKVILSTNIAESSITIDDVDAVIDCGLSKQEGFDVSIGTRLLSQSLITKSNVCQRKGRAGRVRDGICVHLYTRDTYENKMTDYPVSGLLNSRLDQVILQVKASGYTGDIRHFLTRAVDCPSDDLIDSSVEFLHNIAAIDKENNERLTPCGYLLSQLPCDCQIGKMVLFGAVFHCLDPIITIASFMSAQDPFFVVPGQEAEVDKARKRFLFAQEGPAAYSDHLMLLKVYQEWLRQRAEGRQREFCDRNFLSESKLWNVRSVRLQLLDLVKSFKFLDFRRFNYNKFSDKIDLISFVLAVSMYPNIAKPKRMNSETRPIAMKTGTNSNLMISQRSACYGLTLPELPSIYYVYFEKVKNSSGTIVYDLSPISPLALLFCARHFQGVPDKRKDVINEKETFLLDEWLHVKVNVDDLAKIINLRKTFDQIVEGIIVEPRPINIDSNSKIANSIQTIVSAVCSME